MRVVRCPSCKTAFEAKEAATAVIVPCPSCSRKCRIPAARAGGAAASPAAAKRIDATPPAREERPDELDVLEEVEEEELEEVAEDDERAAAPDVVRQGRPRKKRLLRARDGDLERVNLGLGFHYACILALLAGLVGMAAAFPLAMGAGAGAAAGAMGPAEGCAGMAILVSLLSSILIVWVAPPLGMVGSILCLWAPAASGARGFSIAAMALNSAGLVVGTVVHLVQFLAPRAGAALAVLSMAPTFLMTFLAWAMFMTFLRRLSLHLGQEPMADEASAVLGRGIVILVATPFVFVLTLVLVLGLKFIRVMAGLAVLVCCLYILFVFLKRQLNLIGSIRQVIASRF